MVLTPTLVAKKAFIPESQGRSWNACVSSCWLEVWAQASAPHGRLYDMKNDRFEQAPILSENDTEISREIRKELDLTFKNEFHED